MRLLSVSPKSQKPVSSKQGSLHYTPEHCNLSMAVSLYFGGQKQHVSTGCKMNTSFKEPCQNRNHEVGKPLTPNKCSRPAPLARLARWWTAKDGAWRALCNSAASDPWHSKGNYPLLQIPLFFQFFLENWFSMVNPSFFSRGPTSYPEKSGYWV